MKKVVHLFETFKTIIYFNFSELGKVLFWSVKVWKYVNRFEPLNLNWFQISFKPRRPLLCWGPTWQPPPPPLFCAEARHPPAPAGSRPVPATPRCSTAALGPHSLPPRGALRRPSPTLSCPFKMGTAPSPSFPFSPRSSCSSRAHLKPPHPSLAPVRFGRLEHRHRAGVDANAATTAPHLRWEPPLLGVPPIGATPHISLSHGAARAPQAATDPRGRSPPLERHRLSATKPPYRRQPSFGELRSLRPCRRHPLATPSARALSRRLARVDRAIVPLSQAEN
jgi:hypothetical protein